MTLEKNRKKHILQMVITLILLDEIISKSNKSLGELTKDARTNYPVIGEYNFFLPGFENTTDLTPDAIKVMEKILDKVKTKYSDGKYSDFDTLTIEYPDWNFNLRPSANDPLIRLSADATSVKLLKEKQKELTSLLEQEGCKYVNDAGVKY